MAMRHQTTGGHRPQERRDDRDARRWDDVDDDARDEALV